MKTLIILVIALAGSIPASSAVVKLPYQASLYNANPPQGRLSSAPGSSGYECGSLFEREDHKGSQPLSIQESDSSCNQLLGLGYSLVTDGYDDLAFDTACYYLRHCYAQADPDYAFGPFDESLGDTDLTAIGRATIKSFLLSILPLRSDDGWFCQCVLSLGASFRLDSNEHREGLSLDKWLIDNPRCGSIRSALITGYDQERHDDYHLWQDTMHAGEVYDSSLLTMEQLGLDSVLKIAALEGVHYEAIGPQIILGAYITANPYSTATSVALSIGREAYIHIGVYDVLGHQIAGAGYDGVFEQGTREVPLMMNAAPPGIYYVRISTANNETRTLKITKQ